MAAPPEPAPFVARSPVEAGYPDGSTVAVWLVDGAEERPDLADAIVDCVLEAAEADTAAARIRAEIDELGARAVVRGEREVRIVVRTGRSRG